MFIAEVSSTGGLVTSFGTSGYASDSASADAVATPYGMALQSDGQIVLVGIGTDFDSLVLERFNTITPSQRLFVEQDADYNVTSLTDASGNVVERYSYDPYGNVTVLNPDGTVEGYGTASSSSYGWTYFHQGLRLDVTTGLYDDRNRVYSASLGRFLQQDPAGYVNGPSLYQLELSNPVAYADPSGLGVGHHIIPQTFLDNYFGDSPGTNYLRNFTTGPTVPPHGWSKEHSDYNKAIKDFLDNWFKDKGIDPKCPDFSEDQAKQLLDDTMNSKNPAIKQFLNDTANLAADQNKSVIQQIKNAMARGAEAVEEGVENAAELQRKKSKRSLIIPTKLSRWASPRMVGATEDSIMAVQRSADAKKKVHARVQGFGSQAGQ